MNSQKECLSLQFQERADQSDFLSSKIGGTSILTAPEYPFDRDGLPLQFFAHLNFADFAKYNAPIKRGILSLFLAKNHHKLADKDRFRFKMVWHVEAANPDINVVSPAIPSIIITPQITDTEKAQSYIFYNSHPRLEEARMRCAFAANGVSFNTQRAADSCYSHLVSEAENWLLMVRIKQELDYLILIRQEDLHNDALDKCFLLAL